MASVTVREQSFHDLDQYTLVLKALLNQKQMKRYCDVIMKVCGKDIYAHSNVLAASSPYFSAFLSQDSPRQFSPRSPQVIEIQIDGSEPNQLYEDAVSTVVDFIYTGRMRVREDNINQISEIAKIMQMDNVVKFCELFPNGDGSEVLITRATELEQNEVSTSTPTNTVSFSVNQQTEFGSQKDGTVNDLEPDQVPSFMNSSVAADTDVNFCKVDKTNSCPDPSSNKGNLEVNRRQGRRKKLKGNNDENIGSTSTKEDIQSSPTVKANKECMVDQENIIQNSSETPLRRTKRIPKPTFKLQGAMKRKSAPPVKGKVQSPTTYDASTPSSVSLTPRKRGRPRKEVETRKLEITSSEEENVETEEIDQQDYESEKDDEKHSLRRELRRTNVFICKKCDYATCNKYRLTQHQMMHNGGKLVCEKCNFKTPRVREMKRHKRQHLLELNICSFCDWKATDKEELESHLERHTGEMPYFCPVCDVRYKTRTQLNLHTPKHSDQKPFVCDVCNVGFKWKHALKNHMIVHSSKKDHLCDVCGYATAHKSQLKAHRLIHTGETFKCNHPNCNFQATKRQNLKYHMLTHTREKPHQCDVCGQSFSLVKNMRRHMLLHTDVRPHLCTLCDFSTTRYDKLKEHLLKQHNIGAPPERRLKVSDLASMTTDDLMTVVQSHEDIDDKAMTIQMIEQAEASALQSQPVELITAPSSIVRITKPNGQPQSAEIIHVTSVPSESGMSNDCTEVEVSPANQLDLQTLQYAEVLIPASQMSSFVQQVTYVTQ